MACGSLLLSFDKALGRDIALRCAGHGDNLSIETTPGLVTVRLPEQGVTLALTAPVAPFDLMLSWDALGGWIRLAAWSQDDLNTVPVWAQTRLSRALPGALLAQIAQSSRPLCAALAGLALSAQVLPIAQRGGVASTARVATPRGPVMAGQLVPGQIVLTADGDLAQIRSVRHVHPPVWSAPPALRLRAPYLGLSDDVIVDGNQLIGLSGADVEYLCGAPRVAFRAGDILGQQGTLAWRPAEMMHWVQIVLERPAALIASGLPVYSHDPWMAGCDAATARLGVLQMIPAALWPEPGPAAVPQPREQLLSLLRFRAA